MFGHELDLTVGLSERFPELVPGVLAVDRHRNWMLIEGAGEDDLSRYDDLETWQAALRAYAGLQVEMARRTDWLFGQGCPDRRLDRLGDSLDSLLADTPAMLPGTSWGLTKTETDGLRARAPEFKAACRALSEYAIPYSVEHGDFGYWQVIVTNGRSRFIDWSDSSVSHPFFSLWFLLEELQCGEPNTTTRRLPGALDRVRADASAHRGTRAGAPPGLPAPGHHLPRHDRA